MTEPAPPAPQPDAPQSADPVEEHTDTVPPGGYADPGEFPAAEDAPDPEG
jgi:hypothetical protein